MLHFITSKSIRNLFKWCKWFNNSNGRKKKLQKIGKDGVLELIEKMKQDGYLSSDYQYELKTSQNSKYKI